MTFKYRNETLTQERLKSLLMYNPDSGYFVWLQSLRGGCAKAGQVAGSERCNGYLAIKLDGKSYLAHRLAWFYMHGKWPENQVDHINCDKTDNRFSNLRDATPSENTMNTRLTSRNKSGYKGVYYDKNLGRWRVYISIKKRQTYIGSFSTAELAHEAYCGAAKEHHGEFARVA